MKKDSFVKDALVLCGITLASGLLLGAGYSITKEPIAETNRKAVIASYQEVMPAANYDEESGIALVEEANAAGTIAANNANSVIQSAVIAEDESGAASGYIVTVTSAGYGGDIKVVVGVNPDVTISGISYPEALPETPGLGQKATQPKFYEQFTGKGKWLTAVKSGQGTGAATEIDSISGATITSKAVVAAVNAATEFTETYFLGGGEQANDGVSSATGTAAGDTAQDAVSSATGEGAETEAADGVSAPTDETETQDGAAAGGAIQNEDGDVQGDNAASEQVDGVSAPTDMTNTLAGPAKEAA